MISVAEQFSNLRNTLGSILGIFTIIRWIRTAIAKVTGRPPPATSTDLTPANFHQFNGKSIDGSPAPPRASKKPFIIFLITAFGLPYLMGKLIRVLAQNQEQRLAEGGHHLNQEAPMDPAKLDFCRALYDFTPESNNNTVQGVDLAVRKGDLVAVLSRTDPMGNASDWWLCRSREGKKGYLPAPYLEIIRRNPNQAQLTTASQAGSSPPGSRVQTMTSTVADFAQNNGQERNDSLLDREKDMVRMQAGKGGIEAFQRNLFDT